MPIRILILFIVTCTSSLRAITLDVEWLIGSGSWNTGINWAGSILPTGTDSAVIDPLGSFSLVVTVDATTVVNDLQIGSNDTVSITNANSLTFDASSDSSVLNLLTNASLSLSSAGSLTNLIVSGGTLQVTGAGAINLSNSSANRIQGVSGSDVLNNQALIQGAGHLGNDSLTLVNSGTVSALYATNLVVNPDDTGGFTNTGTLQAAANANLQLTDGTFTNTVGQILAQNGATVLLNSGVTIVGGTLGTSGSGIIQTTGTNSLSGSINLSSGSTLRVLNASSLNLADTFTNSGTLELSSSGSLTNLIIASGGATLAGGTVALSNSSANRILSAVAGAHLTNACTIQGAGQLSVDTLQVTNTGTITALYSTALSIDPDDGTGFTNSGTINTAAGGVLTLLDGTFTNTNNIGTTDGTLNLGGGATISGGNLFSSGTGQIINVGSNILAGLTIPGGSVLKIPNATNLTLDGNITNHGAIEVTSSGAFTNLIVSSGGTTLSGTGTITFSGNPARIMGSGTPTLTNQTNTLRGYGSIGADDITIINQATIEANSSGNTLTIDPHDTGGLTNTGTLQSVNGGTLALSDGTFTNTSALIRAQSGSHLGVTSATIEGGNVDLGPSAQLELTSATLSNTQVTTATNSLISVNTGSSTLGGTVNLSATTELEILNTGTLILPSTGTYVNTGSITLNSGGSLTNLIVDGGNVSLSGGGSLVLENHPGNRIYGTNGGRLINNNNTISGGGQLGLNLMGFTNHGTVVANDATALVVDVSTDGLTNTGTLRADAGSTLSLSGSIVANAGGTLSTNGTGAIFSISDSAVTGGTLDSSIGGSLRSSGANTFDGITLTAASTLTILNASTATFASTLNNVGTVSLESSGSLTNFVIDSAGLSLSGGGTIALGARSANRIYGSSAGTTLTNLDNTVSGSGQLGVNVLQIDNRATIEATDSTVALTIDPSGTGVANQGTLQARNGATLVLSDGDFSNNTGTIKALDTARVEFSGVNIAGGQLQSAATAGLFNTSNSNYTNVSFDSETTFNIQNATTATFDGTLHNPGTVNLLSSGSLTNLVAGPGGLTLTGGGTITLSATGDRIFGSTASTTLTVQDQTLAGYGQLGVNQLHLVNQDTITANVSGQTLQLQLSNGLTNTGTIRAQSGGTLLLLGTNVTNTGGNLTADSGSDISLAGSTIHDGTLTGPVNFSGAASTLDGVTISTGSLLTVPNTISVYLKNSINHQGTFAITSSGSFTNLVIDAAGATLTGSGGTTQLTGTAARIYGADSATTLTVDSDQTIRGGGQLGANQLHLVNHGTITADSTTALTVDLSNPLNNSGTLEASGSGGLIFNDALNNNHNLIVRDDSSLTLGGHTFTQNTGEIEIEGGSFTAGTININGGSFNGHGSVFGPTTFAAATFSPHEGTLNFDSILTLNSDTTIRIEIGGTNATTDYGNVLADTLALSGDLQVRFTNSFQDTILATDTFTLFTATTGLTGTFDNLPIGTRLTSFDGLGSYAVTYHPLSVTLSDFQPIPEPSTWALMMTGGFMLILRNRRHRRP
ncbi:PEP-CTERM sorting domain-containing protein [Synoicihabitans lomoniglobus]|uniref:PEP-CTERM sorting domain-containing protein n=1 Tax=Synoicihabitans lomoniglobus TaxID=2909285 RepID=A0AAE9ZUF9_9BACT|nr:PEP-CTERM sorting domain-containing protein [Opitutaceae bacterium LMO-M01]WED64516.1 PEP-CTERM sorting domain-containing protein [Opitutaceae bacterium LMO-M01]